MKNKIEWERLFIDDGPVDTDAEMDEILAAAEELGIEMEPMPVVSMTTTPFGIFRVDDSNNPVRKYDFWLAHTNFKITHEVLDFLNNCDGIESLQIITQYRFRIAIGKLFDNRKVRMKIEAALCGKHKIFTVIDSIPYEDVQEKIKCSVAAAEEFKYWVVYILPNGEVGYKTFTTVQDYNDNILDYDHLCRTTGSLVITHEDKE